LNVKRVELADSVDDLLTVTVELNKKTVGPKVGKAMPKVLSAAQQADAREIAAKVARGESVTLMADGVGHLLEPADFNITFDGGDDWAAAVDRETAALIDRRLTPELRQEGLARDLVRNIQNLRKQAGLNIEDRIVLSVQSDSPDVQTALSSFGDYICQETLATELINNETPTGDMAKTDVALDGAKITLAIHRSESQP